MNTPQRIVLMCGLVILLIVAGITLTVPVARSCGTAPTAIFDPGFETRRYGFGGGPSGIVNVSPCRTAAQARLRAAGTVLALDALGTLAGLRIFATAPHDTPSAD